METVTIKTEVFSTTELNEIKIHSLSSKSYTKYTPFGKCNIANPNLFDLIRSCQRLSRPGGCLFHLMVSCALDHSLRYSTFVAPAVIIDRSNRASPMILWQLGQELFRPSAPLLISTTKDKTDLKNIWLASLDFGPTLARARPRRDAKQVRQVGGRGRARGLKRALRRKTSVWFF